MASTGKTRTKFQSYNFFATLYNMMLVFFAANGINIAVEFDTWNEVFSSGEIWTAISLAIPTLISLVTKIIDKVKDGSLWNYTFLKGQNFLVQVGTLIAIIIAAFGLPIATEAIFLAGAANGINFLIHYFRGEKIKPIPNKA